MARVITITSGQAGVGKTSIGINLALHLAAEGKRTCFFDAALGLETIRSLLGVTNDGAPKELIGPRRSLSDVLVKDYQGIDILYGSPAMDHLTGFGIEPSREDTTVFNAARDYDYLLIDGSVEVGQDALAFCLASAEVILVITPDPDSLIEAYGLFQMLQMNGYPGTIKVVVNRCTTIDDGRQAYATLEKVAKSYLDVTIPLLGLVFEDAEMGQASERRQAVALRKPESLASRGIRDLANGLIDEESHLSRSEHLQFFWSRLLWLLDRPLISPKSHKDKNAFTVPDTDVVEDIPEQATLVNDGQKQIEVGLVDQMVTTLSAWLEKAREWQAALQVTATDKIKSTRSGPTSMSETEVMAKVLSKYSYEKQQVGYREAKMKIYYVERENNSPLACAFHGDDIDRDYSDTKPANNSAEGE